MSLTYKITCTLLTLLAAPLLGLVAGVGVLLAALGQISKLWTE